MGQRPAVQNTISNVKVADVAKTITRQIENSGATGVQGTQNADGKTWTLVFTRPGNNG